MLTSFRYPLTTLSLFQRDQRPDHTSGQRKTGRAQNRAPIQPPGGEKTDQKEKRTQAETGNAADSKSPSPLFHSGRTTRRQCGEKADNRTGVSQTGEVYAVTGKENGGTAKKRECTDDPYDDGANQKRRIELKFSLFSQKNTPNKYDSKSYLPGCFFIQKIYLPFLASSASIFAVVEIAHFFVWIRTRSSPVSKVIVSSVI